MQTDGGVPSRARLAAEVPAAGVVAVKALAAHLAVVTVSGDAASAAAALTGAPQIASASPDLPTTLAGTTPPETTQDPYFSREWDLWDTRSTVRAGGYGIDAPRAWTKTLGDPSVVVAVLDTGITDHPDLSGASVLPGYDFVSGTGGVGSGDGDGWDADPSDPGDACASDGEDSSWHGTFVTSEIVAQHNTAGVAGAAPGVSILPVRVLGACGGVESDTIAAIEWASGGTVPNVPVNPHPANIISMSLATESGSCSPALQTAIDDAISRGTTVIAAAGNESHGVEIDSPANCAGVVSVVATTRSGSLASYSNRGDATLTPTIAAPGGSVDDPVLGDTWTSTGAFTADGNKAAIGEEIGTSMAAPRVAAAAALLLSVHPGLTPAEVTQRLVATATPFPKGSTCTAEKCGAGIVNAGTIVGATHLFVAATGVRIDGSAHPGRRLTADAGTWHPAYRGITYQWSSNGTPIAGAEHRTFVVPKKDLGRRITVTVTVTRPYTTTATATSKYLRVRS